MCGEKMLDAAPSPGVMGSPPRVRGKAAVLADMELKPVAGKQYLVDAYTKALKLVEAKYRWQKH